jgi:hypothetical protein
MFSILEGFPEHLATFMLAVILQDLDLVRP